VVIAWIGGLKYTSSEAMRIQQYIQNSPLTSWLDGVLNAHLLSAMLGTVEILAALLVALSPWAPRLSALGSAIATLLFVTTLSFLFTTPCVGDSAAGGFPALSPVGRRVLVKRRSSSVHRHFSPVLVAQPGRRHRNGNEHRHNPFGEGTSSK
jgi:uncharacterized membrane protein YkgB